MINRVIFIIKGKLEANVPIISQILLMNESNIENIIVCTSCDTKTSNLLSSKGIKIIESLHKKRFIMIFNKIDDWNNFKKFAFKQIKQYYSSSSIIYIGSVDTVIALGSKILKYKFVIHIRELYDKFPWYLLLLKKYTKKAIAYIVPDYSRAFILINWLNLESRPLIIPNKPFFHPRTPNLEINDIKNSKIMESLKSKNVFIYQGLLDKDRDIMNFARALRIINNSNYVLLIMGKDNIGVFRKLKEEYDLVYHIDYVPAPFHLQITSWSKIGIVSYDTSSLNNIFCAPNKIFEYSGFGIPMICCDNPSLKYSVEAKNAGLCVDTRNIDQIVEIIKLIMANYEYYSSNSKKYFDEVKIDAFLNEIVRKKENDNCKIQKIYL